RASGALGVKHFFFSSRRRHTRFSRDWSSDVCSSDLGPAVGGRVGLRLLGQVVVVVLGLGQVGGVTGGPVEPGRAPHQLVLVAARSEERRVGKEGRRRGAPYPWRRRRRGRRPRSRSAT